MKEAIQRYMDKKYHGWKVSEMIPRGMIRIIYLQRGLIETLIAFDLRENDYMGEILKRINSRMNCMEL